MKKTKAIVSLFLILLAGIQITLSSHYCGGKLVNTSVNLTGHTASCNMEMAGQSCSHEQNGISEKCCTNENITLAVSQTFIPANEVQLTHSFVFTPFFTLTGYFTIQPEKELVKNNFSPPPGYSFREVGLANICVFRI
jgi:hypothetical protein